MAEQPITAEDLISRFNASKNAHAQKITEIDVLEISKKGCRNIEGLRIYLKMEKGIAADLEGTPKEKTQAFLEKWQEAYGCDATYYELVSACLRLSRRDDAEFICSLLEAQASSTQNESEPKENVSTSDPPNKPCLLDEDTIDLEVSPPEMEISMESTSWALQQMSPTASYQPPQKRTINIILAGRGKSKLFYNIFENTLPPQHEWTKNGNVMHITCIDGRSTDKEALITLKRKTEKVDLLVYCMSISPGTRYIEQNPDMIQSLNEVFKYDIWKHCVIALTFSNVAWDGAHKYNKRAPEDEYISYIRNYVILFQDELDHINNINPDPNLRSQPIFNYGAGASGIKSDDNTIPAIPAGLTGEEQLLPGIKLHGQSWTDEIFFEMKNKCSEDVKDVLQSFRMT